jgi:hypothetical protein
VWAGLLCPCQARAPRVYGSNLCRSSALVTAADAGTADPRPAHARRRRPSQGWRSPPPSAGPPNLRAAANPTRGLHVRQHGLAARATTQPRPGTGLPRQLRQRSRRQRQFQRATASNRVLILDATADPEAAILTVSASGPSPGPVARRARSVRFARRRSGWMSRAASSRAPGSA